MKDLSIRDWILLGRFVPLIDHAVNSFLSFLSSSFKEMNLWFYDLSFSFGRWRYWCTLRIMNGTSSISLLYLTEDSIGFLRRMDFSLSRYRHLMEFSFLSFIRFSSSYPHCLKNKILKWMTDETQRTTIHPSNSCELLLKYG